MSDPREHRLKHLASEVILDYVQGTQDDVTADWLVMRYRSVGVTLAGSEAERLAELIRSAFVAVQFPDDGLDNIVVNLFRAERNAA